MVGIDLKTQQMNLISSLRRQGILDESFDRALCIRDETDHEYLADLIIQFFTEADHILEELTRFMNEPDFDFETVMDYNFRMKATSACVGGARVITACRGLFSACKSEDFPRCREAFREVKEQYECLKDHLEDIYRLENTIVENEERRKRRQQGNRNHQED